MDVLNQQGNNVNIDSDIINILWAITNGLMPAGGMFGGLCNNLLI